MNQILVPTDFTEVANNAVDFATNLAIKNSSDILIFHCGDSKIEENEYKLNELVSQVQTKMPFNRVKGLSSTKFFNSETIKDLIGAQNISLVVTGTIGDDADFEKKLYGTNSAELAEGLKCPVLVVPLHCKFNKLNKIAYASDLNFLEKEVPIIIEFAKPLNAEILLFHVGPVFPDLGNIEKRNIRKEVEMIADQYSYSNVHFYNEKTDFDNQTHAGIKHFVKTHVPDILALFHSERGEFEKFLITTETDKAVTQTEVPVLVFPKN